MLNSRSTLHSTPALALPIRPMRAHRPTRTVPELTRAETRSRRRQYRKREEANRPRLEVRDLFTMQYQATARRRTALVDGAAEMDLIRGCERAAEDVAYQVWDVEDVVQFYG